MLPERIELSTSPLPRECSTTELRQRANGEGRLTATGQRSGASLRRMIFIRRPGLSAPRGSPSAVQTSTSAAARASIWASVWKRAGGDAQPLGAARHGRVVDRLDIDAVLLSRRSEAALQASASPTITGTIWVGVSSSGQAGAGQDRLGAGHLALLLLALGGGCLEVADRGRGGGGDRRGQGGGEDEAGREAADRVDHGLRAGRDSRP